LCIAALNDHPFHRVIAFFPANFATVNSVNHSRHSWTETKARLLSSI
jgi:hypothetical protein